MACCPKGPELKEILHLRRNVDSLQQLGLTFCLVEGSLRSKTEAGP